MIWHLQPMLESAEFAGSPAALLSARVRIWFDLHGQQLAAAAALLRRLLAALVVRQGRELGRPLHVRPATLIFKHAVHMLATHGCWVWHLLQAGRFPSYF